MEVALTCRAARFRLSPNSAPKNKVSGARCEVSGYSSSTRRFRHAGFGRVRSEKNYVPILNVYENKQDNKVSGVRCKVSGCSSWLGSPGRRVRDVRSEKTTFQAGMCMKTNNTVRSPRSEVQSRKVFVACAPILTPSSLLLTPALQKMKVQPEMLIENTRSGTRDTGTRDTGRADSGFCFPRNPGPRGAGRACVCDGIWEHLENKGAPNRITHHKSLFANALAPCF